MCKSFKNVKNKCYCNLKPTFFETERCEIDNLSIMITEVLQCVNLQYKSLY